MTKQRNKTELVYSEIPAPPDHRSIRGISEHTGLGRDDVYKVLYNLERQGHVKYTTENTRRLYTRTSKVYVATSANIEQKVRRGKPEKREPWVVAALVGLRADLNPVTVEDIQLKTGMKLIQIQGVMQPLRSKGLIILAGKRGKMNEYRARPGIFSRAVELGLTLPAEVAERLAGSPADHVKRSLALVEDLRKELLGINDQVEQLLQLVVSKDEQLAEYERAARHLAQMPGVKGESD